MSKEELRDAIAADAQETLRLASNAAAREINDPNDADRGEAARLFALGAAELTLAAALSRNGAVGGGATA